MTRDELVEKEIKKNDKKIKRLEKKNENMQDFWDFVRPGWFDLLKFMIFVFATCIVGGTKILWLMLMMLTFTVGESVKTILSMYGVYKHKLLEKILDKKTAKNENKIQALKEQNKEFNEILKHKITEENIDKVIKDHKEDIEVLKYDYTYNSFEKSNVEDEVKLINKLYKIKSEIRKQDTKNKSFVDKKLKSLNKKQDENVLKEVEKEENETSYTL